MAGWEFIVASLEAQEPDEPAGWADVIAEAEESAEGGGWADVIAEAEESAEGGGWADVIAAEEEAPDVEAEDVGGLALVQLHPVDRCRHSDSASRARPDARAQGDTLSHNKLYHAFAGCTSAVFSSGATDANCTCTIQFSPPPSDTNCTSTIQKWFGGYELYTYDTKIAPGSIKNIHVRYNLCFAGLYMYDTICVACCRLFFGCISFGGKMEAPENPVSIFVVGPTPSANWSTPDVNFCAPV